jgi:hypothetical protein
LIAGSGPAHRAKKAGAFVPALGRKLRLFLPLPYLPDRNPGALVWKHHEAADLLGRNSLSVFCALSLPSLSGQMFRFVYCGHVASDAFIAILGVLLLGFIAWTAEWRERLRAALANKPQSL